MSSTQPTHSFLCITKKIPATLSSEPKYTHCCRVSPPATRCLSRAASGGSPRPFNSGLPHTNARNPASMPTAASPKPHAQP